MSNGQAEQIRSDLEQRCNATITERFAALGELIGGREGAYETVMKVVAEVAPGWAWIKVAQVDGVPQIRLTQRQGEV